MKPNLGIKEEHLQAVAEELNKLLADETVLYIHTKNYHWNIEGANFNEMHIFYENQYTALGTILDEVAERIRTIGHFTEARLADYLKLTHLIEQPYTSSQQQQLINLLSYHETIVRNLRRLVLLFNDTFTDIGSGDFVTQLLSRHEKMAWMIRAYLG